MEVVWDDWNAFFWFGESSAPFGGAEVDSWSSFFGTFGFGVVDADLSFVETTAVELFFGRFGLLVGFEVDGGGAFLRVQVLGFAAWFESEVRIRLFIYLFMRVSA